MVSTEVPCLLPQSFDRAQVDGAVEMTVCQLDRYHMKGVVVTDTMTWDGRHPVTAVRAPTYIFSHIEEDHAAVSDKV